MCALFIDVGGVLTDYLTLSTIFPTGIRKSDAAPRGSQGLYSFVV